MGLIGLVFIFIVIKTFVDARIDHEYAKQGLVSPRLERKYGSDAAAREATAGHGLMGFLHAAWLDYWPRRVEALKADRDARAANPGARRSLRDRFAAAKRLIAGGSADDRLGEHFDSLPDLDPPAEPVESTPVPSDQRAADVDYRPPQLGDRYTDTYTGRVMEWDGGAWAPVCRQCDIPMAGRDSDGWLICQRCGAPLVSRSDDRPRPVYDEQPQENPVPDPPAAASRPLASVIPMFPAPTEKESAMSQPVAEVTGLQSAIAYANGVAEAHAAHGAAEGFAASLAANDYGDGVLAAVAAAQEASANAAAAWKTAASRLEAANTVKEAYGMVPDAGRKQHLMAE